MAAANEYSQPGVRQTSINGQSSRADQLGTMTAMGGPRSVAASSQPQSSIPEAMPAALRARSHPNATHPPSELQAGAPNGYTSGNGYPDTYMSQNRQDARESMAGNAHAQLPARVANGARLSTSEYRPPVSILPQSSLESPKLLPARRHSGDSIEGQLPRRSHPSDTQMHQQHVQGVLQSSNSPSYSLPHHGLPDVASQASDLPETASTDAQARNRLELGRFTEGAPYTAPYTVQGHPQAAMRGSIPRQQALMYVQPGNPVPHPPIAGYIKQATYSGIMHLLQMGQSLTSAIAQPGLAALESWVHDYFTPDAYIRFKLADNAVPIADYEIPSCTLARFYSTLRDSGACSFQLMLDSPSEAMVGGMNTGRPHEQLVQCQSISWIVGYTSGSTAISRGKLRAIFVPTGNAGPGGVAIKMRRLEWSLSMHKELVDRDYIKHRRSLNGPLSASSPSLYPKQDHSPSDLDSGASPLKEDVRALAAASSQSRKRPRVDYENSEAKRSASPQKSSNAVHAVDFAAEGDYEEVSLPPNIEGLGGLNPDVLQVLETGSLMDKLGELLAFSIKQKLGPIDALQRYAELCMPMLAGPIGPMTSDKELIEGSGLSIRPNGITTPAQIPPDLHNVSVEAPGPSIQSYQISSAPLSV